MKIREMIHSINKISRNEVLRSLSQWLRCLRRGFEAHLLLGLRIRTLPGSRMFVSCECCFLSGIDLNGRPIPSPENATIHLQ
jgi:hypothetical protein